METLAVSFTITRYLKTVRLIVEIAISHVIVSHFGNRIAGDPRRKVMLLFGCLYLLNLSETPLRDV